MMKSERRGDLIARTIAMGRRELRSIYREIRLTSRRVDKARAR